MSMHQGLQAALASTEHEIRDLERQLTAVQRQRAQAAERLRVALGLPKVEGLHRGPCPTGQYSLPTCDHPYCPWHTQRSRGGEA